VASDLGLSTKKSHRKGRDNGEEKQGFRKLLMFK
jgi:hypothetical protein